MTTVLVTLSGPVGSHPIASDLQDAGISVLGSVQDRSKLVQEVLRRAPDVLICHDPLPGDALFNALQTIAETSPRPVMVFTSDSDASKIARASEVGVHAYVVNGYGPERLRPLIHVAQARFAREQAMRAELTDLASRFDERKMVDRAKAILMRARQVSDDDAFQMLRTASMHSNQRLGRVSEHIVHSARFAEDVNHAGQLRMLSQRLVVLSLFELAGVQVPLVQARLRDAIKRVDSNLAGLEKSLSKPTFGDLLGQVGLTWGRLKPALLKSPNARQIKAIDDMAEQLLQDAERLTTALENAGAMPPLQVLNIAGRQRMLSQRFAKYSLLAAMARGDFKNDKSGADAYSSSMQEARAAFENALQYLGEIPLTSADIRQLLGTAATSWSAMLAGAAKAVNATQGGVALTQHLETLASASEEALTVFENLSVHYEQSLQMLVG
jgi:AmiR/NasT family two-component response regulator